MGNVDPKEAGEELAAAIRGLGKTGRVVVSKVRVSGEDWTENDPVLLTLKLPHRKGVTVTYVVSLVIRNMEYRCGPDYVLAGGSDSD